MHPDELWQEFGTDGESIPDVGHPPAHFEETREGQAICGTVSVWLYRDTPTGRELLFQKRADHIRHNPGRWSVSVSGHVNVGESKQSTAVREVQEELGIAIDPDRLRFAFSYFNHPMCAINNAYLYDYAGQPDAFNFSDTEVAEVRWVPLEQARDFIAQNVIPNFAAMHWYWDLLLDYHLKAF